ncbi:MAG TPA: guanylate kinase [Candidatus Dormibacteraeota bacterium]|nr:guanylate kinase [Candidatus Dormibacteraeota bacterium]
MNKKRGLLIVMSGPSGVGKDTLIKRLLELDPNLRYSVSCTTRQPRPNEVDGVDYSFVSRERFQQLIDDGAFLEHATYNGNLYGTLTERVERERDAGHDVVLKIEVQGAEQVRAKAPDAIFIFVVPPSVDELVRRQVKRNTETTKDMTARRLIATREMEYASRYDHVVVNDELERAVAEVLAIINEARARQT